VEMGLIRVKATILLHKLKDFKVTGVPLQFLSDTCAAAAAAGPTAVASSTTTAAATATAATAASSSAAALPSTSSASTAAAQPLKHTLGTGNCASLYYCGRVLGREAIPGSDGQCGPNNGPQCSDCKVYQAEHPPLFYTGCIVRVKSVPVEEAKALQKDYGGWAARMEPKLGCEGYLTDPHGPHGGLRIAIDGASCEWNPLLVEFVSAPPFPVGTMIAVRKVDVEEAKHLFAQKRVAWSDDVEDILGRVGVVTGFGGEGYVRVKVDRANAFMVTALLEPMKARIFVGAMLRVRNVSVEEAKSLQKGHGGFADRMEAMLGKVGQVMSIDDDGDLRMTVNNSTACFNPNLTEPPDTVTSFSVNGKCTAPVLSCSRYLTTAPLGIPHRLCVQCICAAQTKCVCATCAWTRRSRWPATSA